jgi:hypothetical protein
MRPLLFLLGLGLAGCGPAPRSVAWFEAHPDVTAEVLTACADAKAQGGECANARQAQARIKRTRRMDLYRRSFQ